MFLSLTLFFLPSPTRFLLCFFVVFFFLFRWSFFVLFLYPRCLLPGSLSLCFFFWTEPLLLFSSLDSSFLPLFLSPSSFPFLFLFFLLLHDGNLHTLSPLFSPLFSLLWVSFFGYLTPFKYKRAERDLPGDLSASPGRLPHGRGVGRLFEHYNGVCICKYMLYLQKLQSNQKSYLHVILKCNFSLVNQNK